MEANLQIALRDSKTATRPYVILNPLLAKHLAVSPTEALRYFELLAEKIADVCRGEKVLVIGFAETATAVGAAVAAYIGADCYVHTTREERVNELLLAEFLEEHSHAKNQALYLKKEFKDLSQYDRIVFVEDEVTTGKTILNFLIKINYAEKSFNGKITISALVFNGFDESLFSDYEADFFCIQEISDIGDIEQKKQIEQTGQKEQINRMKEAEEPREIAGQAEQSEQLKYMDFDELPDPRNGIKAEYYRQACQSLAERIKGLFYIKHTNVHREDISDKSILILGTEEFMYPALILGRELEKEAKTVKSHSTTRSPLLPKAEEGYPIRTKAVFASPYDTNRETYLYNLGSYDLVIVLTDSQDGGESELLREIRNAGNQKIYFLRINYAGNNRLHVLTENKSTFHKDDVNILLRDISGALTPLPSEERERLIQGGVHYSEMLPLEYKPSERYLAQYYHALDNFSGETAIAVMEVAEKIYLFKKEKAVLVSLARAGTPAGILIKRYIKRKYGIELPHYTISIVRGRGIDKNAMEYILERHKAEEIQFVDAWTGKGAILKELCAAARDFLPEQNKRFLLAVIADPANITELCGTHDDIPIASSFLNSTVCGLMSRTVIRPGIKPGEFHGAAFFEELKAEDRTYEFIERIESHFEYSGRQGLDEVKEIAAAFAIEDINFVKPGIGEATRVLLRRLPDRILIAEGADPRRVAHLRELAEEKNVRVESYPLRNYQACGIIRSLTPDA